MPEPSFIRRHFGTDILAGGWILLLATIFYTAYSVLFLIEMWGDTFPRVFFAWDNFVASLIFLVAGVYFALLGYPAEIEKFENSMLVDLDTLTWREKYFTANSFLMAVWMFIVACGFYYAAGIVWIIYGQPLVGVTFLLSTFIGQAACFIWAYAAMPANMQSNNGHGSSVLFDVCCGCDDYPWLKARIGTDALLGNWLFFLACFGASVYGVIYVLYQPASSMAWTMFAFASNMALGSYLYLRAFDPETQGGSLFFGDPEVAGVDKAPLINYGATGSA